MARTERAARAETCASTSARERCWLPMPRGTRSTVVSPKERWGHCATQAPFACSCLSEPGATNGNSPTWSPMCARPPSTTARRRGVLMVLVGHSWMLGSMTEELQDEVYGADPDTIVPGSLAPVGSATECDGGWLIDGRWPFTSGAIWGEWFLLGSQVLAQGERPRLLHVVIPREGHHRRPTTGMRSACAAAARATWLRSRPSCRRTA